MEIKKEELLAEIKLLLEDVFVAKIKDVEKGLSMEFLNNEKFLLTIEKL
jgi:hypothetical protein